MISDNTSSSSSSSIPRKRDRSELHRHNWQPGDECEAEFHDMNYVDTIHPVRIISVDWNANQALIKLMAFDDNEPLDFQDLEDLHPFRAPEPNYAYAVGDKVHFRMWKRKVNGAKVDGYAGDEEGIWVKGVITEIDPSKRLEICVRHYNWDATSGGKKSKYKTHWVVRRDVRLAAY
jgi:hypothetical protein